MLTTAASIDMWILAAVFCSLYLLYCTQNQIATEIQHGPKYKVHILAKHKYSWMQSSWFCYQIKFPDTQLPKKVLTYFNAANVSMVKDRT